MPQNRPSLRAIDLIDLPTAAEICGVSVRTIRLWISTGRLPAYRLGGRLLRVRAQDIDGLLTRVPAGGAA